MDVALKRALFFCGCLFLASSSTAQVLSDAQRVALQEARYDRNWPLVISLLREAQPTDPTSVEIALGLAEAYTKTLAFVEAQRLLETEIAQKPDCFACYPALWEARLEEADRSTSSFEETRLALAMLEKQLPDISSTSLPEFLQALYRGYELIEDDTQQERIAQLIIQKADASFARSYIAQAAFTDLLRRRPNMSPEKFVREFPDYGQIDLVYELELSRRVAGAQRHTASLEAVKDWASLWKKARPKSRKAFAAIAQAYDALGIRSWRAKRYFKRAIRLAKRHPEIDREPLYTNEVWERQIQTFIDDTTIDLARHESRAGRVKRARKMLLALEERNRFNGNYLYGRAQVAMAQNLDTEALDYFQRTLDRRSHETATLNALKALRADPTLSLASLRTERAKTLRFPEFTDETTNLEISDVKGSWIAWADYDGDGRLDLLVGGGATLLHQERGTAGKIVFRNVWKDRMPKGLTHIQSGVFADVDRDGDLDLFAADGVDDRGTYNRVLINRLREGKGFVDETKGRLGIYSSRHTAAAAWADYDHDGYLDLYVANFEKPGERIGYGYPHFLFHNVRGKRFEEVSQRAGAVSAEPMCGRGVTWGDIDNDGLPDAFVCNYRLDPNFLYHNVGNGHFRDVAKDWGTRGVGVTGYFGHSIGAEIGDWDNDGDLDIVVCNLAHPRALAYSNVTQLLRNDSGPSGMHFSDVFAQSGIHYEETHSDPSLGDLDNDGDLDLILTAVYPGHPVTIYQNDGTGHFSDVSFASGIDMRDAWGAALADYDGDGFLDVAIASQNGIRIYHNRGLHEDSHGPHYLLVKPVRSSNRHSVIGARVYVDTLDGKSQIREIQGGKGTGNQHAMLAHFGLGPRTDPVTVRVRFPNGTTITRRKVRVDQTLTVSLNP